MKKLYINNISGLYDEFYNPKSLIEVGLKGEYLDVNQIFWHQILDDNNIRKVVNVLINNIHIKEHRTYRNLAITANPNLFIKNILDAKNNICDQGITSQSFFQYLETLETLCDLYSRFWFYPYQLTLEQGLMINKISSKETSNIALNPSLNPIYIWVNEEILPIICDYNPDLIFLEGSPSTFFFTVAKLIKQINSNAHVCITRHSSEYFSLSKIDFYLKKNTILFSYIDTVILNSMPKQNSS